MRFGVDVSEHQAGFDFTACPLDFAIIRTTDGTYQDHAFAGLFVDARSAHLNVSTYHFLRSPSEGTSVAEQVEASVEVLQRAPGAIQCPMWLDVESPAGLTLADVRSAYDTFQGCGVRVAGVYTNAWYWRRYMRLARPSQFGALWLADWGSNNPAFPGVDAWPSPLVMGTPEVWQYTSRGSIGGFTVDLNAWRDVA